MIQEAEMSERKWIFLLRAIPLAFAAVALAPGFAGAQSGDEQPMHSAATSAVYRGLTANESRMLAARQDKEQVAAAIVRTNTLRNRASPAARSWVASEGRQQARRDPSLSAVAADARARFGNGLSSMDIDQLVQLVMMEVARDSEQDLRDDLAGMQAINRQKQAQRDQAAKMREQEAALRASRRPLDAPVRQNVARADLAAYLERTSNGKDSLADLSEEQQLRMQMDRMQKALEAMSNLEKKMSDTDNAIIGNLK
jgi:hypothetical protein